MASAVPRFVAIQPYYVWDFLSYTDDGCVSIRGEGAFSPLVKIEAEPSKTDNSYVNLRFCYSNRYWARGNAEDGFIVAESNQPEEDTSNLSCTLFKLNSELDNGIFDITHVQTGWGVYLDPISGRVFVSETKDYSAKYYTVLDWDTLVKLPQHVAFKGDNGSFLQAFLYDGLPYLQFSSQDANDETSGHQVNLLPNGYLRIKSLHFDRFWRLSPSWILADWSDDGSDNVDAAFWPVKIDDNTVAIRCIDNNFCERLTEDQKTDCLNAAVSTITNEARFGVVELVLERKVYNVRYRMEDARVFGEMPFLAGTTTAVNVTDQVASIAVQLTYSQESSYSFTRSVSVTAGVKTTIEADLLEIVKGSIEISSEITGSLEWANTETTTKSVTATGSVSVAPRSTAVVNYVGTIGTCNVPYYYTQQDTSSTDGTVCETDQIDGIYTGVSCYNFSFEVQQTHAL